MKIDLYGEWKALVQRCILSCNNPLQLEVAKCMLDRFYELYKGLQKEYIHTHTVNELIDLYLKKEITINYIK